MSGPGAARDAPHPLTPPLPYPRGGEKTSEQEPLMEEPAGTWEGK